MKQLTSTADVVIITSSAVDVNCYYSVYERGNGVQVIGNSAIRKCAKLETLILPKSLTVLGPKALYGCKKLRSLTIKANVVIDIKAKAIIDDCNTFGSQVINGITHRIM